MAMNNTWPYRTPSAKVVNIDPILTYEDMWALIGQSRLHPVRFGKPREIT